MQKLQNEKPLTKINQFLSVLRVSEMGLSWCLIYLPAFSSGCEPLSPSRPSLGAEVLAQQPRVARDGGAGTSTAAVAQPGDVAVGRDTRQGRGCLLVL